MPEAMLFVQLSRANKAFLKRKRIDKSKIKSAMGIRYNRKEAWNAQSKK